MAKNYIEDGDTIDFTAKADQKSGDLIALSALMAVVLEDVVAGGAGVAATTGVWDAPKAAGTAITQGAAVYLKDGAISLDDTGVMAGKAWTGAASDDTVVAVKINA